MTQAVTAHVVTDVECRRMQDIRRREIQAEFLAKYGIDVEEAADDPRLTIKLSRLLTMHAISETNDPKLRVVYVQQLIQTCGEKAKQPREESAPAKTPGVLHDGGNVFGIANPKRVAE